MDNVTAQASTNEVMNCLQPEFLEAIASIANSVAWPLAFLLFCFFFRKMLDKTISSLTDKLTKVSKDGVEFSQKNQRQEATESIADTKNLNDALKDFPLIEHYAETLEPELTQGQKDSNLPPEEYYFARTVEMYLAWQFERIYRLIYSGQINALYHLGNSNNLKASKASIEVFYDAEKEKLLQLFPNMSFSRWLNFLQLNSLIIVHDTEIEISLEGQSFLAFIDQHYPKQFY